MALPSTGAQPIEEYIPGINTNGLYTNSVGNLLGSSNTINNPIFTGTKVGGTANIVNVNNAFGTNATLTTTQSGSTILMGSSQGTLIHLPTPVLGLTYKFVVTALLSSGTHALVCSNTSAQYFLGAIGMGVGSMAMFTTNGTASTAMAMNGTTSGGSVGTVFDIVATSTQQWAVNGQVAGSGVQATPFTII